VNKDKIIDTLGDLTFFVGLLILQAHHYDAKSTTDDSKMISLILRRLSTEIGLSKDDITAIIAVADNKINKSMNKVSGEEE
jgi:hypothetical protein|tara:strand:+ start:303 stop:545 length:243 start_codon:yes stop_codon:yes gene_type:complete